jgi:RND family efflux transporter MFP subunit
MKKSTIIIVSIIVAFILFVAFKLVNNKKELNEEIYKSDASKEISITWEAVKNEKILPSYTFSGSFEPLKEVQILPERSGKVTKINIDLGDYVSKGTLIATLDSEEMRLSLADNQTIYNDALVSFERNKALSAGEAITKNAFEKSELALKGAKNRIDIIKKQMSYLSIYAPSNGYITSKTFEFGSIVSPGMPIAMITDISSVKLNIQVPENTVTQFKSGSSIEVSCDALMAKKFNGIVDYVSVKADDSKNFMVKIKVPNTTTNPIRSGMFGKAYFKTTQPISALMVSRNAIVGSTKNPQVYIIKNGTAILSNIAIGRILDDKIEVITGLTEGDLVANSGLVNLSNGVKVKQVK